MAIGLTAWCCSARVLKVRISDYDIAVFLKALSDRRVQVERLARLRVDFLDADAVISAWMTELVEADAGVHGSLFQSMAQGRRQEGVLRSFAHPACHGAIK
jgi:hypothetical protein